jgi:hypothetical protein
MGQQEVFNYPIVSTWVPAKLINLYTYPMGYQSHSFVNKDSRKLFFDNSYLRNLLYYRKISSMGQHVVFNHPRVSFKVPITPMAPYSYQISQHDVDQCSIVKNLFSTIFGILSQMSGYGGP